MHNQKIPNVDRHAYSRHVNISFDGMHVKGHFGVSRNTNEIVGLAED